MNLKNLVLFICICIISACSSINCVKPFSTFSKPIEKQSFFKLRTNGVYVSQSGRGAFFIYKNGKAKIISSLFPIGKEFWNDPKNEIEKIYGDMNYSTKECWGDYTLVEDSILIHFITRHNNEPCKRWVFEETGIVLNDSIIKIETSYSFWGKDTIQNEPNIFRFFPTNIKPDSNIFWYKNKSWYIKNLHESRE